MTDQLLAGTTPAGQSGAQVCRLYLVRHGTTTPTTPNTQNRYRGRKDVPLDAQGYQDAAEAARSLSHAGLSAVYTSPLRRAVDTAQIIADEAWVPDLRILSGLNNLDYGAWEGMTPQEAGVIDPEEYARYTTTPSAAACPAGERLSDAQERMFLALALIGSRHPGEAVVAVTHAAMIRLVLVSLGSLPEADWRLGAGPGPVTELVVSDGEMHAAAPAVSVS
jgi:broad specificity phosphatase PhoE